MISSVVPVKLPSIRGRYFDWYNALKFTSFGMFTGCGRVNMFAAVFSGRGSHVERCTVAAHAAPDGRAAAGASVAKYPPAGGRLLEGPPRGGGTTTVVVVDAVVDVVVDAVVAGAAVVVVTGAFVVVVARVVVVTRVVVVGRRLCNDRLADAVGIEMPRSNPLATDTVSAVCSLRFIPSPRVAITDAPKSRLDSTKYRQPHTPNSRPPCVVIHRRRQRPHLSDRLHASTGADLGAAARRTHCPTHTFTVLARSPACQALCALIDSA